MPSRRDQQTSAGAGVPEFPDFDRVLETLPTPAYVCDANGLITYYNSSARALWGREPRLRDPRDRFCGSFRLFTPDGTPIPHDRCWMALALQHERAYHGEEIVIERADGTRYTALAHISPFHDADGRLLGAVNVLVDITERKQLESRLRDADRAKDAFLAMLAHELRNPLSPLMNALDLMRLDPGRAEFARTIMERQIRLLTRLVDDLLDVHRITRNKLELRRSSIVLQDAVQAALESSRPLIEEKGHELIVSLEREPIAIDADLTRLAQVFANVLNNAAKYTREGGRIWLTAQRTGSDAVVRIRDTGIGIPPDMIDVVFEPFRQASASRDIARGGLGVGLTLARQLVELHDGTIEATSDGPDRGSEFTIRLPAPAAPTEASAHAETADEPAIDESKRVLVIDDNEDTASSLALLLQMRGYETRMAFDGVSALEVADTYRPDIMLLDIGLPRLDGYEVCKRVRAQPWGRDITIVAVTGWGNAEQKLRAKEAGFDDHMTKPVDLSALRVMLARLRTAGAAAGADTTMVGHSAP